MSTPGVSLFQGTESIQVNTSLERAEEEEALEDQRRRNEELGNLLQNAFDDLDDDETTVDSTTNFQSNLVDHNRNADDYPYEQIANAGQQFETELHQLNILLDSKNRELESIKQMVHEESKKRDETQKRLAIAEAELNRALASKANTHELLVESKEKCSNLESIILKLKNEKKSLEAENNSLLGKLETAQTLLSDVQRKYDMVERDLNRDNDRNAEIQRKNLKDRHRAEIEMMQQQIDQIANKLEKKTVELENMNTRYRSLQNSHEAMLVDKASKINDLNNALNEAQKKCEELLCRPDYFQENVRLQKLVASLQDQIIAMENTISTLNERLEFTTAELNVMDSVLHQHNMEDTPRKPPSQTHGSVAGTTPLNTVDRVGSLKAELYRALASVKNKRDEIKKLQRTLEDRNAEIKLLKGEENKSLVQITTLKEDKIRLENRVKVLEEEFDELRTKSMNKSVNNNLNVLAEEIRKLREEKNSLEQRCNELERERNSYELERKKLDINLKNVEVDLEELKQEHESMKRNYENILKENQNLRDRTTADNLRLELERHKFLLKDAQTENDRLKNLYVDIVNAKETLSFELEKLRCTDSNKQLKEEQEKVESLQRLLKLAEVKFEEISRILEQEKINHEREFVALKEKLEKERKDNTKDDKNAINSCKKCLEYLGERTRFEIESLKLKNQISITKKEVDNLVQKLSEAKAINVDLSDKLKMSQECQEGLIKELQKKANQFGEYMKGQSSSSDKSISPKRAKPTPKCSTSTDKCVATSPKLERNEIMKIEARIRDEMAKIFAVEIKRYQIKFDEIEERNIALKSDYEKVLEKLKQRQSDVDVLKQAIIVERESVGELLAERLQQCEEKMEQQQKVMLQKYRDQLQEKDKKIEELIRDRSAKYEQIKGERQSMKTVMAQWEARLMNVEKEWQRKLQDLKKEYDGEISTLQSKNNSLQRYIIEHERYLKIKGIYDSEILERLRSEKELALKRCTTGGNFAPDKGDQASKNGTDLPDKANSVPHRSTLLVSNVENLASARSRRRKSSRSQTS